MNRNEKIREIANELNDMGFPCCRCMDCTTCTMAEEILDGKRPMPPKGYKIQATAGHH